MAIAIFTGVVLMAFVSTHPHPAAPQPHSVTCIQKCPSGMYNPLKVAAPLAHVVHPFHSHYILRRIFLP